MAVVKIGGSLFDLPDLGERILRLLDAVDGAPVLLAGGGALVDVIRDWDRRYALGEVLSHQLALRGMSLSARMLASLSPRFRLINHLSSVAAAHRDAMVPVVDAAGLLLDPSVHSRQLPQSWNVTSDSIAAWLAQQLGCRRVILVKSVDTPETLGGATCQSLVDPLLHELGRGLQIAWVNLRARPESIALLQ